MKTARYFLLAFLLIVFFAFGFYFGKNYEKKGTNSLSITRSRLKTLTNPLLDCEVFETNLNSKTNLIKKNVEKIIENHSSDVSDVSVYYRDLNNGPWFGINEKDQFAPASLLKVPVMMAYLKMAEENPLILSQKINYSGNHDLYENLPQKETLTQGATYTIDNLIYRMIALSDNLAFELLLKNIPEANIQRVHEELGIIYPDVKTPEDYISVKSYAGLFRVLYNSTYLSRTMSEKALQYLQKTDFHLGIQAGIPQNTLSALKYGIRNIDQDNLMQIHDCGVVYHAKNPYLLCVMTKGNDREKLVEVIKNISKTIYESIDREE